MTLCEVAVIVAGPYGLSVAAHLHSRNLAPVVFGDVMGFWKTSMPKGIVLRSPLEGSHIGHPDQALTLDHFLSVEGVERREPVPIEFFIRYGEWFQRAAVAAVDPRRVCRVESLPHGFSVSTEDGSTIRARRVVVATGLAGHEYRPPQFTHLASELATHCSAHSSLDRFAGRHVAVVGAGQSALESAALLLEAGAAVDVIARTDRIHWIGKRTAPSSIQPLLDRFHAPAQIGPFPLNWLVETPDALRLLPPTLRRVISRRALRPAGASWLIPRLRELRLRTSRVVVSALEAGGRVRLKLDDRSELSVDHILLATGYRLDLNRYGFLAPELTFRMASSDRYPVLSRSLESSIAGLYFAGAAAVSSLGPLMRFVAGSNEAGRRIAAHVGRQVLRNRESRSRISVPAAVARDQATAVVSRSEASSLTSLPSVL